MNKSEILNEQFRPIWLYFKMFKIFSYIYFFENIRFVNISKLDPLELNSGKYFEISMFINYPKTEMNY